MSTDYSDSESSDDSTFGTPTSAPSTSGTASNAPSTSGTATSKPSTSGTATKKSGKSDTTKGKQPKLTKVMKEYFDNNKCFQISQLYRMAVYQKDTTVEQKSIAVKSVLWHQLDHQMPQQIKGQSTTSTVVIGAHFRNILLLRKLLKLSKKPTIKI